MQVSGRSSDLSLAYYASSTKRPYWKELRTRTLMKNSRNNKKESVSSGRLLRLFAAWSILLLEGHPPIEFAADRTGHGRLSNRCSAALDHSKISVLNGSMTLSARKVCEKRHLSTDLSGYPKKKCQKWKLSTARDTVVTQTEQAGHWMKTKRDPISLEKSLYMKDYL